MKVACYARVSSEKQAEKDLSIPAQLKSLRKYALAKGWEVVAEYVDEAESARSANRPQFKEMIAATKRKTKPFEAILVWKLSRFARNREDSIIYKSLLRKQGIQVISINELVDDSAAGKLLEGMIEVIDEFYCNNLAEDVVRGMTENAQKGFSNGGTTPFGYRRMKVVVGMAQKSKFEPEESEAPIIKRIFQMALDGQGGKEIAKSLNRAGVPTRSGKPWGKTTINKILQNAVHTGDLVWKVKNRPVVRTSGAHPALVSKEDFDTVQRLLLNRQAKARHPRTVASQYLLGSLLCCSRCGAPMIGCSAKSGRFSYYRCNRALRHDPEICRSGWIPKQKIEGFVIDRLKEKVLTDANMVTLVKMVNEETRLLASGRQERLEEIEAQIESVSHKLLKYYVAFEKGTMNDEHVAPRIRDLRLKQMKLQQAKDELQIDLEENESAELDAELVLDYVQDLRALLSNGTLMQQKAFLRSFIRKINFEPDRVAIDYTIPMPAGEDGNCKREVLSIEHVGGPSWARTKDLSLIRTAL